MIFVKLSMRSIGHAVIGFGLPLLLSAGLSACGEHPFGGGSKKYQIPWPQADGSYAVQPVYLETFESPHKLEGLVAQVLVEPYLDGGKLTAETGVGRFIESGNDLLIPADFVTLQATTVYAHMEKLHRLAESVGATSRGIWPARIGVRARVQDGHGGQTENNAMYDGALNAILLVPYSQSGLPITLNGGVIAHEHFHAIFQNFVLSQLPAKAAPSSAAVDPVSFLMGLLPDVRASELPLHQHACGLVAAENAAAARRRFREADTKDGKLARPIEAEEYNTFVLRGLNEGLADFWGWVHTGDPNFIRHSLEWTGDVRSLNADVERLPNAATIAANLARLRGDREIMSLGYTLGTHYARFLRRLSVDKEGRSTPESRERVARAVVASLGSVASHYSEKMKSEFISPEIMIPALYEKLEGVGPDECRAYEIFAAAPEPESTSSTVRALRPKACQAQGVNDSGGAR